jgi:hypothetical protein
VIYGGRSHHELLLSTHLPYPTGFVSPWIIFIVCLNWGKSTGCLDKALVTPASARQPLRGTCSGSWFQVENQEAVSHVRAPKFDPATQVTYPCYGMCDTVMENILWLTEEQRLHPRHELYTCGAYGRQFWLIICIFQDWKQYSVLKRSEWKRTGLPILRTVEFT